MPRAVVTDGSGFLGSHVCDALVSGGYDVVCLDNFLTGTPENIAHLISYDKFQLIRQDVSEYLHIDGPVNAVLHFASPRLHQIISGFPSRH